MRLETGNCTLCNLLLSIIALYYCIWVARLVQPWDFYCDTRLKLNVIIWCEVFHLSNSIQLESGINLSILLTHAAGLYVYEILLSSHSISSRYKADDLVLSSTDLQILLSHFRCTHKSHPFLLNRYESYNVQSNEIEIRVLWVINKQTSLVAGWCKFSKSAHTKTNSPSTENIWAWKKDQGFGKLAFRSLHKILKFDNRKLAKDAQ